MNTDPGVGTDEGADSPEGELGHRQIDNPEERKAA